LPTIERSVNVSGGFGGVMLNPSETAGMDAAQKNKEFFKRMKAVRSWFYCITFYISQNPLVCNLFILLIMLFIPVFAEGSGRETAEARG